MQQASMLRAPGGLLRAAKEARPQATLASSSGPEHGRCLWAAGQERGQMGPNGNHCVKLRATLQLYPESRTPEWGVGRSEGLFEWNMLRRIRNMSRKLRYWNP